MYINSKNTVTYNLTNTYNIARVGTHAIKVVVLKGEPSYIQLPKNETEHNILNNNPKVSNIIAVSIQIKT